MSEQNFPPHQSQSQLQLHAKCVNNHQTIQQQDHWTRRENQWVWQRLQNLKVLRQRRVFFKQSMPHTEQRLKGNSHQPHGEDGIQWTNSESTQTKIQQPPWPDLSLSIPPAEPEWHQTINVHMAQKGWRKHLQHVSNGQCSAEQWPAVRNQRSVTAA